MDSSPTGHSFSPRAPFQHTITIIHFIVMSVTFIGCYPYAFTQWTSRHSHRRRLISLGIGVLLALVGFVTGWFIQYSPTTSSAISIIYSCFTFALFCIISLDLGLEYVGVSLQQQQQRENGMSHQHHHDQQPNNMSNRLYLWAFQLSPVFHLSMTWATLCLGYFYLIFGVLVLTSTCESLRQCWLPLATGTGFLLSGSLTFLYLVGILILPPHTYPEYYQAIWILFWGCLSFFWWDMTVVGSSWKGIDFGLLWSTGGLLSLVMTFQTWLPVLQKRNIINSIIICLTGKGILSGHSENDFYAMELQTTLGNILIIGSAAIFIQIIFRKTGTDNLPRLYSRIFGINGENCDDDDTCVNDLDIRQQQQQQRSNDYESTYRQLTGMNPSTSSPCKHQSVYASITMVCGLLSCVTMISGGLFFIGAIVKWVETMQYYISNATTYVNVLLAMAFLWISYLTILCSIYKYSTTSNDGYDYLGVATGDYCELPVSTKLSSSPTTMNFDTHNMAAMMTTPTSSTSTTYDPTTHQSTFTSIPLGTLGSAATKHHASPPSSSNGTAATQVMRPSQYRAKRRSLLVSTSMHHHDNGTSNRGSRTLSSSSHAGVGGILPDDIFIYGEHYISSTTSEQPLSAAAQQQQCHSPTFEHPSWQSVTSSSLSSSSPPPPLHVTMLSTSSTTTNNNNKHFEPTANDGSAEQQERWAIHKTESGKRKERQWKKSKRRRAAATGTTTNPYTHSTDDQGDDDAHSVSDGFDGPGHFDYSSSDGHV